MGTPIFRRETSFCAVWVQCHTGLVRVQELAEWLNAPWEGDATAEIHKVASLEDAGPGDVTFVSSAKAAKQAAGSSASCLIVPETFPAAGNQTIIRTRNPRQAIAKVISRLHPKPQPKAGVHPTAIIGDGTVIGAGVSIGPYVAIGAGARIGDGSVIGTGSAIGDGVSIGKNSTLNPKVTIYPSVTIGDSVVLHSGCVIGTDGFGYVMNDGAWENFPQIGRVEIGDRVEIGANACVDRAALGVTSIGEGTKLDNMVHIGHNCRIGRHVVIAAQTGISGGVVVEDYAVIGGQVGIGDKARIESRAILGSGSGVLTSKIVRAGQVMWGTPARPLKEYLEQLAVLSKLAKKRRED
jgi:UDP-3-O-[3-hydroxymyristoyl] glucosamine N-acyltransferase